MKTKYVVIPLTSLIILLAAHAFAFERKNIGLGVIAGQPTGITAKYVIDDVRAIDGGIGWKTSGDNEFHIYADYLYHMYDLIKVQHGTLPLYFGGGLRFIDHDNEDDKFGVRLPVGVEYLFKDVSLGAFFELAPVLNLTPDTDFDLEGGIGIRFFF